MLHLSNKFASMVQTNTDIIIEEWMDKIDSDIGLENFSSTNQDYIKLEGKNLLKNLKEWIGYNKTKNDIGKKYVAVGRKLFELEIPICDAHQALSMLKRLIWRHITVMSLPDSALEMNQCLEFFERIILFFDRAEYYLFRGYTEKMNQKIKSTWKLSDKDTEQIFFKNSFY